MPCGRPAYGCRRVLSLIHHTSLPSCHSTVTARSDTVRVDPVGVMLFVDRTLWQDPGALRTPVRRERTSMGFLTRFFDRKRATNAATAADLARSQKLRGGAIDQDHDEQAATRTRMEAELVAQRERRDHPPTAGA